MTAPGRSYPLTKGLTGLNRTSASSSKADVQNVRARGRPDVCLWPKADIETESKSPFLNVCFGEKSGRSEPEPSGVISTTGVALD